MKSGTLHLLNKRQRALTNTFSPLRLTVIMLLLLSYQCSKAQTAASYAFSSSTGTYASIAATGSHVSTPGSGMLTDDGNEVNIPIGFGFSFCGTTYFSVAGCANGVLSLSNNGAPFGVAASNIQGAGFLMPMWADNYGDGGTPDAFFQISGPVGSRVFTLEWTNFDMCCVTTAAMNFQVKLYEGSNRIEFCYGSFGVSPSGTIGIANSTTDFLTLPSSASTTANTSFNTTNQPAGGTILSWIPPCGLGSRPPIVTNVIGGGGYCTGGIGVDVGIAATGVGNDYQLLLNGSPVGSPVPGPGRGFYFGPQTAPGLYTVIATDHLTGCTSNMTGSARVYQYALPNVYATTGGGTYCPGDRGVHLGIAGSDPGVNYMAYISSPVHAVAVPGNGASLDFGLYTAAGTYTVVGTAAVTGCQSVMTGNPVVTINSSPVAYTVTGGGGYCVGTTGSHVGLSNSDAGVNYQLLCNNTIVIGAPVAGTGAALDFGPMTMSGTYTVVATDLSAGCIKKMAGSALVYVNPLPTGYYVTGGGKYCAGSAGIPVYLAGSVLGNNYQLMLNGSPLGSPVAGNFHSLNFGNQTAPGVYTVVTTNTTTGCVGNMLGSATVTVVPLPTAFNVTGGGNYCSGTSGSHVGLSSSSVGVNYQLYRGTALVGYQVAGTGNPIDFGAQKTAGTYTVVGIVPGVLCTTNMIGSVNVGIDPLPTAYTVSGGGGYCLGGSGVHIYLNNSDAGVNYQLYRYTNSVVTPVAGTGGVLDFGAQTTAGVYTIVAVNATTGCTKTMTGNASVTITALPVAYPVLGGGGYCTGGSGVPFTLPTSQLGVVYQLFNGATPVGSPLTGLGHPLNFGLQTAAGTYTIVGSSVVTGCVNNMLGSVPVTINPLPNVYSVTGGGTGCSGTTSVAPGLSGSDAGVNYQLYNGTIWSGSPVAGTGSAISFAPQTSSGTYTVVAKNATTGCTSNMGGNAIIAIGISPIQVSLTGGGSYCSGGTGVHVGLTGSGTGISYQLYLNGSPVGSPVTGAGTSVDFGAQTGIGTYTAVATDPVTGCTSNMLGSKTIFSTPSPAAYTVTGGGGYCAGGYGVHIYLGNSATGVSYRLYNSVGTPVGVSVAGTGAALDFGLMTTGGTYTVKASSSVYACTTTMTGSATVTVNSYPTVTGSIYTVAPASNITLYGSPSGGTWSTGNSSAATVNATSGVVTGVAIGTAVISYTLPTGCAGWRVISTTATGHKEIDGESAVAGAVNTPSLSVVPNPNRGSFLVKGSLGSGKDTEASIEITDVLGKVIYSNKTLAVNGELNEAVTLDNPINGMYLVSVRSENTNNTFRVVITR